MADFAFIKYWWWNPALGCGTWTQFHTGEQYKSSNALGIAEGGGGDVEASNWLSH